MSPSIQQPPRDLTKNVYKFLELSLQALLATIHLLEDDRTGVRHGGDHIIILEVHVLLLRQHGRLPRLKCLVQMADGDLDGDHGDVLADTASCTFTEGHPSRLSFRRRLDPALRDEFQTPFKILFLSVHTVWLGGDDGGRGYEFVQERDAAIWNDARLRGRNGRVQAQSLQDDAVQIRQLVDGGEVIEVDGLEFLLQFTLLLGVFAEVVNHERECCACRLVPGAHVVHDFGGDLLARHSRLEQFSQEMRLFRITLVHPFVGHVVDDTLPCLGIFPAWDQVRNARRVQQLCDVGELGKPVEGVSSHVPRIEHFGVLPLEQLASILVAEEEPGDDVLCHVVEQIEHVDSAVLRDVVDHLSDPVVDDCQILRSNHVRLGILAAEMLSPNAVIRTVWRTEHVLRPVRLERIIEVRLLVVVDRTDGRWMVE